MKKQVELAANHELRVGLNAYLVVFGSPVQGIALERSPEVPGTDHKITLIFVINGEDFSVETNVNAPLSAAAQRALNDSGNSSRPLAEWEVRNSSGALLDISRTVKELGLMNGARLFLSLRVGAGG